MVCGSACIGVSPVFVETSSSITNLWSSRKFVHDELRSAGPASRADVDAKVPTRLMRVSGGTVTDRTEEGALRDQVVFCVQAYQRTGHHLTAGTRELFTSATEAERVGERTSRRSAG